MANKFPLKEFRYYFATDSGEYGTYERYFHGEDILLSYAYLAKPKSREFLDKIRKRKGRVMIDSGGFTNFTAPGTVKFEAWRDFMLEHKGWVDEYVQLDDLRSRAQTIKMFHAATKAGLAPLFVDHLWFNQRPPDVDKLWKMKDKLCLSGFAKTRPGQEKFPGDPTARLVTAMKRADDDDTVTHMLAVGSLRRFLAYLPRINSVDSAAWDKASAYGSFLVLRTGKVGDIEVPMLAGFSHPGANKQSKPPPADVRAKGWDAVVKANGWEKQSWGFKAQAVSLYHVKRYVRAIQSFDPLDLREKLAAQDKRVEKMIEDGTCDSFYLPDADPRDPNSHEPSWTGFPSDLDAAKAAMPLEPASTGKKAPAQGALTSFIVDQTTLSPDMIVRSNVVKVLIAIEKRKSTAYLLVEAGPPNEWSGGVAGVLGKDGQQRLKALWEALDKVEQGRVLQAFHKMFGAIDVVIELEDTYGKLAKRIAAESLAPLSKQEKHNHTIVIRGKRFETSTDVEGADHTHKVQTSRVPGGAPSLNAITGPPIAEGSGHVHEMKLDDEVLRTSTDVHKAEDAAVIKPFAGYPNFDACVVDQTGKGRSESEARSICGALQRDTEKRFDPIPYFEQVLKSVRSAGNYSAQLTVPIIKVDEAKGIITGVALEPEERDAQGDIISKDVIAKAAYDFLARFGSPGGSRLGDMHKRFGAVGWHLIESWIQRGDVTIGKGKVKDGSWMMSWRRTPDEQGKAAFAKVKSGERTGFSIGGVAAVE